MQVEIEAAPQKDVRAELAAAVVGKGWDLTELKTATMSLEDVFLKLTTREDAAA